RIGNPSYERRLLAVLTVLGTGWMMLCGPATETCTYIMVAPALAWTAVEARRRSVWTRAAVASIFALFAARPALAAIAARPDVSFALQPLATLLLMLLVLLTQVRELFQFTVEHSDSGSNCGRLRSRLAGESL